MLGLAKGWPGNPNKNGYLHSVEARAVEDFAKSRFVAGKLTYMESRQTAVPLDHGHIHKLVSMIVPPGIDRGDAHILQVVPGQMLFSPMMISTGGAMHQLL